MQKESAPIEDGSSDTLVAVALIRVMDGGGEAAVSSAVRESIGLVSIGRGAGWGGGVVRVLLD